MTEAVQIFLGIVFLIAVFILTRIGIGWKMGRAAQAIVEDLKSRGAVDLFSAVELPYAKPDLLKIGMRDYRRKALEYLVTEGAVARTGTGKYFLCVRNSTNPTPPEESGDGQDASPSD